MIRLIVRFGSWLDRRFPEKVVVKANDYFELQGRVAGHDAELSVLRSDVNDAKNGIEILTSRIGSVESKAVHVEAVRTLVAEVKKLQDEYSSLKTSLGINRVAQNQPEAVASLNDLPLGVEYGE